MRERRKPVYHHVIARLYAVFVGGLRTYVFYHAVRETLIFADRVRKPYASDLHFI